MDLRSKILAAGLVFAIPVYVSVYKTIEHLSHHHGANGQRKAAMTYIRNCSPPCTVTTPDITGDGVTDTLLKTSTGELYILPSSGEERIPFRDHSE